MLSWLICYTFAAWTYFLEIWDSHLGAVYRRVNVKLHCMMHHCQFDIPRHIYCFFPHQYRRHSSILFCFTVRSFLLDNVCRLIAGWLFWNSSWYNWYFLFPKLRKGFSFPHFSHLSPHAKQLSSDSCFPFPLQYQQDSFLSPPLLKSRLLWLSLPVWIICLISSWLVSILPVSPSVTQFFPLIMLLLELSQVLLCYLTVSTHHRCLIYCQWWFS